MRKSRRLLCVGLLVLAASHVWVQQCAAARRALLVGCSSYPNLPASKQLEGAAGDVLLVRQTLLTKFQFADHDIVTLAESAGPERRPTRENIRNEFLRLAEESAAGDYVVIHLSGHGSQVPDQDCDAAVDFEPDGLDETFLPRDVGRWQQSRAHVENAIVDDELRVWLAAIVARGAYVFFVADACHSGTLTRGMDREVVRFVPAEELGIPGEALTTLEAAVRTSASRLEIASDGLDQVPTPPSAGGLVTLSAAQAHELAIEEPFSENGPRYGRLSYTLAGILAACDQPISYRELAQRLLWHYTKNGWTYNSTPVMEGPDLDRLVLGSVTWPQQPFVQLTEFDGQAIVLGGTFHQITKGSILAVYPARGDLNSEQVLGYAEVMKAGPFSATIKPIAFHGRPAPSDVPDFGRCELVFRNFGDLRIVVGVVAEGTDDSKEATRWKTEIVDQLRPLAEPDDSAFRLAADSAPAQWFVVARPQGVFLQRAGSDRVPAEGEEAETGEILGPRPLDKNLASWLSQSLRRIAQATNLIALSEEAAANEDPTVDVELAVTRSGTPFAPSGSGDAQVRAGEVLAIAIGNRGREPIAVAVFYVDSAFGVTPFFPKTQRDSLNNEIVTGGALYRPVRFRIESGTVGWEHVIVVAVAAKQKNVIDDLLLLQQPGCAPGADMDRARDSSPSVTPLGRMITSALRGGTRSEMIAESPEISTYAIRRISWNVVP